MWEKDVTAGNRAVARERLTEASHTRAALATLLLDQIDRGDTPDPRALEEYRAATRDLDLYADTTAADLERTA